MPVLDVTERATLLRNLPVPALVERAVAGGEGPLVPSGALAVWTGKYTGRSPKDKFFVRVGKARPRSPGAQ